MSKKVGISAGHYWDEPGKCTPDGYKEINFNMAAKKDCIIELKRCGIEVVDLNPTGNEKIGDKCKRANDNKVDCAHEFHYDALKGTWGEWGGVTTLCHVNAPEAGGKQLAKDIHSFLIQGTKMNDRGIMKKKWIFCAGISAPAAMTECGFMDNKREAELMRNPAYIKECAVEVAKGICKYLKVNYVPETYNKSWKDMFVELTQWHDCYISDVEKMMKETGHNWPGMIEKLYYHAGK